jgi:hypothetical protein
MIQRAALAISLTIALAAPLSALQWDYDTAYAGGVSLGDCTLLYTGSATPKVVYSAAGNVRIGTKGSLPWDFATVAPCGTFGGSSSAAFDRNGKIGIAYIDSSDFSDTAKFATDASGTWSTETVAALGWLTDQLGIAYDATNTPWIAYCDGSFDPSIIVAKRTGTSLWTAQTTISGINESTAPAIAIGPSDTVYVSFIDSATKTLKVASRPSGGSWSVETVDGSLSSPASGYTSIAIDPSGRPNVAYFAELSGSAIWLKLATKNGSVWAKEMAVLVSADSHEHCSVAIAPDSTPWIAYSNGTLSNLACARKASGTWASEVVDSDDFTGTRPSLKLDAGGNPSICYVDEANGNVLFASAVLPRSISEAKKLPDGVNVRIEGLISSTRLTLTSSDFLDRHYAQSSDRSGGMLLYWGSNPDLLERGTYLTVTGVTGRVDGERAILFPVTSPGQTLDAPLPLGMTNVSLGGGPLGYSAGPPSVGQKGIAGASGLSNLGLLVRVWGQVVETNASWFKIDDGAGLRIKCMLPAGVSAPTGHARVTGISSCEDDGSGNLLRVLRIRSADDIN